MTDQIRLSVQLYSLRSFGTIEDQMQSVHDAELSFVETTSGNYDDPDRTRRALDRYGLAAPSGHVGIERLRENLTSTVAVARSLGTQLLVLWGFPDDEHVETRQEWQASGRELGALARRLSDEGLSFAFHNHDWELKGVEGGGTALAALFEGAAGSPLQWQPDIAWLERGGADVDALIAGSGRPMTAAHVKDLARPGEALDEDGWADLGHGTLDWSAGLKALRAGGVDLFVLEHDEPNDPVRFLTRSSAAFHHLAAQAGLAAKAELDR